MSEVAELRHYQRCHMYMYDPFYWCRIQQRESTPSKPWKSKIQKWNQGWGIKWLPKVMLLAEKRFFFFARLFLLGQLAIANCSLEETPHNMAVVNGSDHVRFKCRSDEGYILKWWMQSFIMSERQVLYDGYSLPKEAQSFCKVENGEPGKFDLNLTIDEKTAQTYTCEEPQTKTEFSADLIIILTGSANTNTSDSLRSSKSVIDDHVIMKCSVEFRGNWAPELEWSFNGTSIKEGVNYSTIPNELVSSVLVLPLNSSAGQYTCTARFGIKGKPSKTTATNVPDFVSSSVLTVEANQIDPVSGDRNKIHDVNGASSELAILIVNGVLLVALIALVGRCFWEAAKSKKQINSNEVGSTDELMA